MNQQRIRSCLIREIDVRTKSETENPLKLCEVVHAGLLCHLHQRNIAGAFDRLIHSKKSVAVPIMTLDGPAVYFQASAAVIRFISGHLSGLKPCRECKRLGDRPRLIKRRDTEIGPEIIQVSGFFLVGSFVKRVHIRLRQNIVCRIVVIIQFRKPDQFGRIIRILQSKTGVGCHPQNLAIVHVLYNTADMSCAVSFVFAILILLTEFVQILLDNGLDVRVQCQLQVVAVSGIDHRSLQRGSIIQKAVGAAGRSVQYVVIIPFKTETALIAVIGKTNDMRRERSSGIASDIRRFENNSLNIVHLGLFCQRFLELRFQIADLGFVLFAFGGCQILAEFCNLLAGLLNLILESLLVRIRKILLHYIVTAVRMVIHILLDLRLIKAELRHCVQCRIIVRAHFLVIQRAVIDRMRVNDDIVDKLARREDSSLGIRDCAAFERQFPAVIALLGKNLFRVLFAVIAIDIKKADD